MKVREHGKESHTSYQRRGVISCTVNIKFQLRLSIDSREQSLERNVNLSASAIPTRRFWTLIQIQK
jgi:hypothetical protein